MGKTPYRPGMLFRSGEQQGEAGGHLGMGQVLL